MPKRVLVVDDEAASRTGLQALLAGRGYRVEIAATGGEALEKARSFRPAVVIADLVMPGMDGLDLLRSLQEEAPFAVTILLTGKGTIETAVQAMKAGAYDYLTKPVDLGHPRPVRGRQLRRPPPIRTRTRPCGTESCGRTFSIALTCSRSLCPPCASARTIFRCWP